MRQNLPVTDREQTYGSDERLISTTNLRGVIQDANETFVQVSGFTPKELQGQPHNMVRHPEMPEAVYANFWDTLKSGKPWMGVIKNRCKTAIIIGSAPTSRLSIRTGSRWASNRFAPSPASS